MANVIFFDTIILVTKLMCKLILFNSVLVIHCFTVLTCTLNIMSTFSKGGTINNCCDNVVKDLS